MKLRGTYPTFAHGLVQQFFVYFLVQWLEVLSSVTVRLCWLQGELPLGVFLHLFLSAVLSLYSTLIIYLAVRESQTGNPFSSMADQETETTGAAPVVEPQAVGNNEGSHGQGDPVDSEVTGASAAEGEVCATTAGTDAPVEDAGKDAPAEDAGKDAPAEDSGKDAPAEDAGKDAPAEDAGNRDGSGTNAESKNEQSNASVASTTNHCRQFATPTGTISLLTEDGNFTLRTDDDPGYAAGAELRKAPIVKNHRRGILFSVRANCFTARDLVKWLVSSNTAENNAAAVEVCNGWVDQCLICPAEQGGSLTFNPLGRDLWRFIDDACDASIVDGGYPSNSLIVSALDLAVIQDRIIHALFDKFLTVEGQKVSVDYRGIEASKEFDAFKHSAACMKRVDFLSESSLTRSQRLAFFINLYNIQCIAALIASGPPPSTLSRLAFFKKAMSVVGGQTISLDEIENGVLRGNRKGVVSLKKPFSPSDSRLPLALASHEPRIHFALVCGARSCPPLRAFSVENVEQELDKAAADFFASDNLTFLPEQNQVSLSKIMSWFAVDFGATPKERLQFYADHMAPGDKQDSLQKALEGDTLPKVVFQKYDWSLNDNGEGAGPVKKSKASQQKSSGTAAGAAADASSSAKDDASNPEPATEQPAEATESASEAPPAEPTGPASKASPTEATEATPEIPSAEAIEAASEAPPAEATEAASEAPPTEATEAASTEDEKAE